MSLLLFVFFVSLFVCLFDASLCRRLPFTSNSMKKKKKLLNTSKIKTENRLLLQLPSISKSRYDDSLVLRSHGVRRQPDMPVLRHSGHSNNNDNNNDDEVLLKREPLVLLELGALYRRKRLQQDNSKNKPIYPLTVHQQKQPATHTYTNTHTHTHTHTHTCTHTHTHIHTHIHTHTLAHRHTHTYTHTHTTVSQIRQFTEKGGGSTDLATSTGTPTSSYTDIHTRCHPIPLLYPVLRHHTSPTSQFSDHLRTSTSRHADIPLPHPVP